MVIGGLITQMISLRFASRIHKIVSGAGTLDMIVVRKATLVHYAKSVIYIMSEEMGTLVKLIQSAIHVDLV